FLVRTNELGTQKPASEGWTTETSNRNEGRLSSLYLGVMGEKGVCAGGGRRHLSFSSRSKCVLYDQEFGGNRVSQARKVPRIYTDRERPSHGARNPRQASRTNGLSSIARSARAHHSTRCPWSGTPRE